MSVAAQRDIDIVAKEGAQRDMPTPPKVGDCSGNVRVLEVFEKMESKHRPKSDGHVGIP